MLKIESDLAARKQGSSRENFFCLLYMPSNQDQSFNSRLNGSSYLGFCNNWDFCGGPVWGLSNRSLKSLGLKNSSGTSGSSSGGDMRDVKKANGRVLRFCNLFIQVINPAFYLSSQVFFCL